jgi:hypothetical protein
VGCLLQEEDSYMEQNGTSRREFVKKAVYIAPAILTLQAMPAFSKPGSGKPGSGQPDKNPPIRRPIWPPRRWWWR